MMMIMKGIAIVFQKCEPETGVVAIEIESQTK